MSAASAPRVAYVVIGLDEGDRIPRALDGARAALAEAGAAGELVYVDSGSTDGSPEAAARAPDVRVLRLPRNEASAAAARNAGARATDADFVHFLDGDMRPLPGFLPRALAACRAGAAVVGGAVVERPARPTLAGRAMGLDWNVRGRAGLPGGAALWRRADFLALGGYDPTLRSGEDPELALRAAASGRRVVMLEVPAVEHDLGLRGLRDWWRRGVACGISRAVVARLHPGASVVVERRRAARRSCALTCAAFAAGAACGGGLAACAVYGFLGVLALRGATVVRRAALDRRGGLSAGDAWLHAVHVYAVKLPLLQGFVDALLRGVRRPVRAEAAP